MARTAVAVTSCPAYGAGVTLGGGVAGDSANGHVIAANSQPKLVCLLSNAHTSAIDITITIPATSAVSQLSRALTKTIPAAVGGLEGVRSFVFDSPAMANSDGIYIDSADGNFNLVTLYAYTWASDGTYR